MKTTLQVPITKTLKTSSEEVAREYGFSSLQEAVRIFLTQLSNRDLAIGFSAITPDEVLSPVQEETLTEKYLRVQEDLKTGKAIKAENVGDFLEKLHSA